LCRCIITYTSSTESEDFYGEGADAKIGNLGGVTLADIFNKAGVLAGKRDTLPSSSSSSPNGADNVRTAPVLEVVGVAKGTYSGWTPNFLLSGQ